MARVSGPETALAIGRLVDVHARRMAELVSLDTEHNALLEEALTLGKKDGRRKEAIQARIEEIAERTSRLQRFLWGGTFALGGMWQPQQQPQQQQ